MILHKTGDGWDIIYQRAHALLAAKLVTHWRQEERPQRWTETLNAIAQHDNGWQEWEGGNRLTAAGTPRQFDETPLDQIVQQAERVVTRAWHQSLWVGCLVSRHLSHLYEERRGESAALDSLLDDQKTWRGRWLEALGASAGELEAAYALLLWGDTFSLILCGRRLTPGGRALDLEPGPDGTAYTVRQRDDGTLAVKPWPYKRDAFNVAVDVHHVPQRTFASDQALSAALKEATASRQVWRLCR